MPSDPASASGSTSHLAALISAARAEADRLGSDAAAASKHLAAAAAAVGSGQGRGGPGRDGGASADQGIRPQDLTTDNDK